MTRTPAGVRIGDPHLDEIDLPVRDEMSIPKQALPVSLGHDRHAIGEWAIVGIEGGWLGPTRGGRGW